MTRQTSPHKIPNHWPLGWREDRNANLSYLNSSRVTGEHSYRIPFLSLVAQETFPFHHLSSPPLHHLGPPLHLWFCSKRELVSLSPNSPFLQVPASEEAWAPQSSEWDLQTQPCCVWSQAEVQGARRPFHWPESSAAFTTLFIAHLCGHLLIAIIGKQSRVSFWMKNVIFF